MAKKKFFKEDRISASRIAAISKPLPGSFSGWNRHMDKLYPKIKASKVRRGPV